MVTLESEICFTTVQKKTRIRFLATFLLIFLAGVSVWCPDGWKQYGSSCYRFPGVAIPQAQAEQLCTLLQPQGKEGLQPGAHLASIETDTEAQFIRQAIQGDSGE